MGTWFTDGLYSVSAPVRFSLFYHQKPTIYLDQLFHKYVCCLSLKDQISKKTWNNKKCHSVLRKKDFLKQHNLSTSKVALALQVIGPDHREPPVIWCVSLSNLQVIWEGCTSKIILTVVAYTAWGRFLMNVFSWVLVK